MEIDPENTLYVKTLLWAYDKGSNGFSKDEWRKELDISGKDWKWIDWMFTNGLNGAPPLIWSVSNTEEYGKVFYLSADGVAAAVDYLELQEARKSSQEAKKSSESATWYATVAIWISIVLGLIQIGIAYLQYSNVQNVQVKNDILKTEITNFPSESAKKKD
jgi:hypothetical protein